MIGRLRGVLAEIDGHCLLVDVAGVGYEVEVSASVLESKASVGNDIELSTHFVVREDAQQLFGFSDANERELFRIFIKINGVGPKLALAIVSNISPQVLGTAVSQNDTSPLTRISGVGSKTAERLILELKSKKELLFGAVGEQAAQAEQVETPDVGSEAQSALTSLGYSAFQARETIEAIIENLPNSEREALTIQELVSSSLKSLGKRK